MRHGASRLNPGICRRNRRNFLCIKVPTQQALLRYVFHREIPETLWTIAEVTLKKRTAESVQIRTLQEQLQKKNEKIDQAKAKFLTM